MKIYFLPHAIERMKERKIAQSLVEAGLLNPDESFENEIRCVVHKKIVDPHMSKEYLLWIFYRRPEIKLEVISVYKTSKIIKYWRGGEYAD